MKKKILERSEIALTFEDVLILPGKTEITPEETQLTSFVFKKFKCEMPFLSSPMISVWSFDLWKAFAEEGAIAPIPGFGSIAEVHSTLLKVRQWREKHLKKGKKFPIVLNLSPFDGAKIEALAMRELIDYVMLDSVQPFSKRVFKTAQILCKNGFENRVVVGNIATKKAAEFFCKLPLAAVKVGLGAGSICTTRMVNGVGVPQLSAIYDIKKVTSEFGIPLISDGGTRSLGDIAKAFAVGADAVMLGRLFASTLESSAKLVVHKGNQFKEYKASYYPSLEEGFLGAAEPVLQFQKELKKKNHRFEGVSGLVPCSGPCQYMLFSMKRAVQNAMAFVGVQSIEKFQEEAQFIRVSRASFEESKAHSLDFLTERNIVF